MPKAIPICKACEGEGVSSKGRDCLACKGTGISQPNPLFTKAKKEVDNAKSKKISRTRH